PVGNPVSDVSRPKIRNGRTRFLTKEEAQNLLDIAKESPNRKLHPYLLVMIHTGMRPSEAAGLTWGDVAFEARLAKLHITKTGMRYVPLTEKVEEVLRNLRPSDARNGTPIFLPLARMKSEQLRNVPCRHFKRAFETARNKAGLEDVHLHDLRHTAASHLLLAGEDLKTLYETLGLKGLQNPLFPFCQMQPLATNFYMRSSEKRTDNSWCRWLSVMLAPRSKASVNNRPLLT
ncbi:MAG: site-specific integrase, partial [Desulfobulbaceae bacterium]|nr:site-specific integrase [Desulfobulbaceae bacterium]